MKNIAEIRRQNLALLVEQEGLANVARRAGKPDRQINDMLAGRKSFGEKVARDIEARLAPEHPAGWLDLPPGENPGHAASAPLLPAAATQALSPIAVWEHPDDLPPGDYVNIPRLAVYLSAGNGSGKVLEVELEKNRPQVFRAEWVRDQRLRPAKLACMYAHGNSMEPRIQNGDSLLVDTGQHDVIDGRVYAVWYADELRVKRLYKRVDGGLIIHSDNERDFPRQEVPVDQLEHIRIIGRIVHVQGTGGL